MTTIENITTEQIETLRTEAGSHGDHGMVDVCDKALDGDAAAIERCAEVISDAEAQVDDRDED